MGGKCNLTVSEKFVLTSELAKGISTIQTFKIIGRYDQTEKKKRLLHFLRSYVREPVRVTRSLFSNVLCQVKRGELFRRIEENTVS